VIRWAVFFVVCRASAILLPATLHHLTRFVGAEPTALVFAGPNGGLIWRGNFNKLVKWLAAVAAIGMP
jgi:hypothetical protein